MLSARHLNACYGDGHLPQELNIYFDTGPRIAVLERSRAGKSTVPKSTNGGPRIDVAVARGLIDQPKPLLHDKPTEGLGAYHRSAARSHHD